jgi:hypothetical protein
MYFEENERKWLSIIEDLKTTISSLRSDRDILLSKYQFPVDTKKVLNNFELNEYNLLEHKRVIKELIG